MLLNFCCCFSLVNVFYYKAVGLSQEGRKGRKKIIFLPLHFFFFFFFFFFRAPDSPKGTCQAEAATGP